VSPFVQLLRNKPGSDVRERERERERERDRERETERESRNIRGRRKGQVKEYLAILVDDLGALGRERRLEWQRNHSLFARLEDLGESVFKKGISGERRSQEPEIKEEEEWENDLHPAFAQTHKTVFPSCCIPPSATRDCVCCVWWWLETPARTRKGSEQTYRGFFSCFDQQTRSWWSNTSQTHSCGSLGAHFSSASVPVSVRTNS
jgi:hypothetical protein